MERKNFFLGDMFTSHYSGDSNERVVLYFHGFPGPTSDNPVRPLKEDLAATLGPLGWDLVAPRYTGLGESNGKFGFLKSLHDGLVATHYTLAHGYREVCFLGYSYGAIVALHAYERAQDPAIRQFILLAPYLHVPQGTVLREFAEGWKATFPESVKGLSVNQICSEIDTIRTTRNPLALLSHVQHLGLTVIRGARDEVVPPQLTESAFATFDVPPTVHTLDDDHQFQDRHALMKLVGNIFCR